jgi:hypothetical protein
LTFEKIQVIGLILGSCQQISISNYDQDELSRNVNLYILNQESCASQPVTNPNPIPHPDLYLTARSLEAVDLEVVLSLDDNPEVAFPIHEIPEL